MPNSMWDNLPFCAFQGWEKGKTPSSKFKSKILHQEWGLSVAGTLVIIVTTLLILFKKITIACSSRFQKLLST